MKRKIMLAVAASMVALMPVMAQAANKLIVKGTDGTTDKMVVTDTGYVGVGTNAPSAGLNLSATTIEGSQFRSHFQGDTSTWSGGISVLRNRADNSMPLATNRLGYILFGALDSTTSPATYRYPAGFFAYADGDWTSNSTPAYYVFETTRPGNNYRNEWMRITSSGNVGIATNNPKASLEVNGGLRIIPTATTATFTSPARSAPTKPTCDNTNGPNIRGTFWFNIGAAGVADTVSVCAKDSSDNYKWVAIPFN